MMSSHTAELDNPATLAPVSDAYRPTNRRKMMEAPNCSTSWCRVTNPDFCFFVMEISHRSHDFDMQG